MAKKKKILEKIENVNIGLWDKIKSSTNPLKNFKGSSACIYPEPYMGKADVVIWFYCRNTRNQVFAAVSHEIAQVMFKSSWADVSYEFTVWIEHEVMPHCVQNTVWENCELDIENGCENSSCQCETFGSGDFTYGTAESDEFIFD